MEFPQTETISGCGICIGVGFVSFGAGVGTGSGVVIVWISGAGVGSGAGIGEGVESGREGPSTLRLSTTNTVLPALKARTSTKESLTSEVITCSP